jgi:hypothetical protein
MRAPPGSIAWIAEHLRRGEVALVRPQFVHSLLSRSAETGNPITVRPIRDDRGLYAARCRLPPGH